ncbi:MAG TPA: very short patch repair endonuclease [Bryobacteraceae bacterium]|nr:very short patch repair endonuclease [Bryobacteraceae bacterium]
MRGRGLDTLTPERRSTNMSRIRSRDTSPERIVRRLVYGMGYRYRLHAAHLPGKPDIVLSRLKRIIDVRGCFWHQHPGCIDSHIPKSRLEYWKPKLERNQRRDEENGRKLRKLGWRVCVIWECEAAATAKISKRIARFLAN